MKLEGPESAEEALLSVAAPAFGVHWSVRSPPCFNPYAASCRRTVLPPSEPLNIIGQSETLTLLSALSIRDEEYRAGIKSRWIEKDLAAILWIGPDAPPERRDG